MNRAAQTPGVPLVIRPTPEFVMEDVAATERLVLRGSRWLRQAWWGAVLAPSENRAGHCGHVRSRVDLTC